MAHMNRRYPAPTVRPLRVLPFDPMTDRAGRSVVANVTFEQLSEGPSGRLIEVVDYDATHDQLYEPVDLDNRGVLVAGGLPADESDPRFHQQMVYAVGMRVLEEFERALGRPFRWRGDRRLRIYPHAFEERNAYFDPSLGDGGALVFGYFSADEDDPGANIPGQIVYTCLAHSIVAHETTHAVIHRIRPDFMAPTNPDTRAFHEGLSDIVAYLLPFTYHDVVVSEVARVRSDLVSGTPLLNLAEQFGFARGSGKALRSAAEKGEPTDYEQARGPHARGQVLAAAVMAGFLKAYARASGAMIRLATAGRGLPDRGELHPDLVNEVAKAATKSASRILTVCIRALDYLPPVDVTMSDYLRAMVTADTDLYPADTIGLRAGLIECFRERGIYPTGVASLAERSIRLEQVDDRSLRNDPLPVHPDFVLDLANEFDRRAALRTMTIGDRSQDDEADEPFETDDALRAGLWEAASPTIASSQAAAYHSWAERNRKALGLDDSTPIQVAGFHASQRADDDDYNRTIVSVQFTQTARHDPEIEERLGGLAVKGGTTVIADSEGTVRYVIKKPLPGRRDGKLDELLGLVADLEHEHPELAWDDDPLRIRKHFTLRRIDDGKW